MFNDDMKTARRRAERAITEDGFLDIRNIKLPKPLIADNFDDEVCSLLLLLWFISGGLRGSLLAKWTLTRPSRFHPSICTTMHTGN